MSDDTQFAIQVMKDTFGTFQFEIVDGLLKDYMKVDKNQVVTFWDIPEEQKQYLRILSDVSGLTQTKEE